MTNDANINVSEGTENITNTEINDANLGNDVCFNITEDGTVIIGKPAIGVEQSIEADAAQKYVFSMSSDGITSAEQDGDNLVVTFDNGSSVTLENYISEIAQGGEPVLTFLNGQTFTMASFGESVVSPLEAALEDPQAELRDETADAGDTDTQGESGSDSVQISEVTPEQANLDEQAEQLAQTEPAAGDSVAQQLANIEPAAGDAGGTGASGNSGFGFNSSFNPQGVIPIEDVGPIAPTALEYGIPQFQEDVFPDENEQDELVALNPTIEAEATPVFEDSTPGGPATLSIDATPESGNGTITVTIGNIPNTWTVTGPGTYDAGTGTYTLTAPTGQPISEVLTFTPPADSDVDLIDLPITVSETDSVTGQTGSSSTTVDIIVDAVADDPDVDGNDATGNEGDTLAIDIPTALTGEEVNNGIGNDDGSESITLITISPVDPTVDLNDYTITNANGPVTLDANGNIVFTDRADLNGLEITPNDPTFNGSIDLNIQLDTQENVSDTDFDNTNNTNGDSDVITLTWRPVANPPTVLVNGGVPDAQVLEDGTVDVPVVGTLDPNGSGDEILSLTVTGIDLTQLEGGAAGFDASNGPNGEVWTRVPGSPDDAAEFTITLTNGGENYVGDFIFTPLADGDIDLTNMAVTATALEPATNTTASSGPDDFNVIVDAVADDINVNAADDTGNEGDTLDIDITNVLTGEEINNGGIGTDDGSESIVNIVISPVDPTVDLNNFTITNANGPVALDANGDIVFTDRADLNGLQITPNDPNFVGSVDLNVTLNTIDNANDTDFNTTNDTATDSEVLTLTWRPEANPPTVLVNNGVPDALVPEDGQVDVPVTATLDPNGSGNEILSLTVTGIDLTKLEGGAAGFEASPGPNGEVWTRVPGSPDDAAEYTITLTTGGENYVGDFTFTPLADSDVDLTDMVVTATAFEPATNTTASSGPDDFNVIVDAVADAPEVDGLDDSGNEGATLDIDIPTALTGEEVNNGVGNDDGSESIVNIIISPTDPTIDLNDFTIINSNGPVTLDSNGNIVFTDRADLNGLQITPNDPNFSGSIDLDITLNTTENQPTDAENPAADNNNAQDTDTITLTWNPTIDPPTVTVNNGIEDAQVKEDNSVDVPVEAALANNAGPAEFLTLTVTGVDLTKLQGGEAGFTATDSTSGASWTRVPGSPDNAAEYTITLTPGEAYTGTFNFDPLDQSDLDITNMTVTATSTDDSVTPAISASANDDFNVIVDAVADDPTVDGKDNSGNEGTALSVDIDGALGDDAADGSESIEGYEVRGDATEMGNFTFTVNGVERPPVNGVVTLSAAEVDALVVTPNDPNFSGDLDLTAVILTADNPNDGEFDTTDNTNTARDPFTLSWNPVINPPTVKVNNGIDDAQVLEDNSVDVPVVVDLATNAAPVEFLTITVSGIDLTRLEGGENGLTLSNGPSGQVWTRVAGSPDNAAEYEITLNAGENFDGTFNFDPADDSDLDLTGMSVSATATDPSVDPVQTASSSDDFNVIVDAVADDVDVVASGDSGEEGDTLDITITNAITGEAINNGVGADDSSESLVNIVVQAVDPTIDLNDFTITNANGPVTLDANGNIVFTDNADLNGLQITPNDPTYAGSFDLRVTLNTIDNANDVDFDPNNNTAQDLETITLTWADDDEPAITTKDVSVDETDLAGIPESTDASNVITVDFGDDSAGATITGTAGGFGNPQNVTSNGQPIVVNFDAATNTYTGEAAGETVFTLTINDPAIGQDGVATSSYTFTLLGTVDHPIAGDNSAGEYNDSIPFTFGFNATDSDGDVAPGTITVNVFDDGLTANDDMVMFDQDDGSVSGNVITGAGNTTPGGADDLSQDEANTVTQVNGVVIDQAAGAVTDVAGTYGTLSIAADGSYTYMLNPNAGSSAGGTASLDPTRADADGHQNSFSNNGITVVASSSTGRDVDLTWLDTADGSGLGIDTLGVNDSLKAFPDNEFFNVEFSESAESVTFTIAELGDNNDNGDKGLDYVVTLADGTTVTGELQFASNQIVNGVIELTISEADFGGQTIDSVLINSSNAGQFDRSSFLLNNVEATYPGSGDLHEEFVYTLTDGDGDTDTATLKLWGLNDDEPTEITTEKLIVDESDIDEAPVDQDTDSGTVTANFGADAPGTFEVGNPNNVTFTGAKDNQLASNGEPVTISIQGNTYVGSTATENVFELEIQPNGDYTFTLLGNLDHADATNPDDVIALNFDVIARDSDDDTAVGTITVNVNDDGPSIENKGQRVDEVALDTGDLVKTGTVDFDFGEDGQGQITNTGTFMTTFQVGGQNQTLTSGGETVAVGLVGGAYVGTINNGNTTVFTFDIDGSTGEYTYVQKLPIDHPNVSGSDNQDVIWLKFQVQIEDADGDIATAFINMDVKDDAPIAEDDANTYNIAEGSADGNVITGENGGPGAADDLSVDNDNLVTNIAFGGNNVDVVLGQTASIDGDNGTLNINADGSYEYTPFNGSTSTTTYNYSIDNPPGSSAAGDIKNVETSFVKETNQLDFAVTVDDTADGFTVAVNNGPNPKGEDGLTLFYFDNSTGTPVVTAYAYNGQNTQTSWTDGPGSDPVTKFVSSITDPAAFDSLVATNNADGTVTYSFSVDTSNFNASFDDSVGIWLHPVTGLDTTYGADGYLTDWTIEGQSYYDTSNKPTEINVEHVDFIEDQFTYTLTDGDGDSDTAVLNLKGYGSKLIVGQNVDDTANSNTSHLVGGEDGAIAGAAGNDILIGDAGGSKELPQTQDYNVMFVLDVSGSMGSLSDADSRLSILTAAVENLLNDFNGYQSGEVKVHFTTFSSVSQSNGTFSVSNTQELNDAIAYLQSLDGDSTTNYEAGLQSGIEWLQSADPLSNAETITYFISDGAPNRYLDGTTLARIDNDQQYFDEVQGVDGTNEIGSIQSLSDQVISVGININGANNEAKLDIISSDGQALLIDDANDLNSLLQETSPITRLTETGDDNIEGGDRGDLIFGDVVNTDKLADDEGVNTEDGAGWEVFEELESQANWDRADTVEYITNNAEELAAESTTAQGGRNGGNDVIDGGAGDDTIFGQEGDDQITGGLGDDTLYGGSGNDTFLFESVNDGTDTIKDFEVGSDALDFSALINGYNSLQEAINDFVFDVQQDNGNTVVSVDADGQGGSADAVQLVILEGVSADLDDLSDNGSSGIIV